MLQLEQEGILPWMTGIIPQRKRTLQVNRYQFYKARSQILRCRRAAVLIQAFPVEINICSHLHAKPKASVNPETVSKCKISSPTPGKNSIDPETVKDVPLTESMVIDVYADIFQGLGKFPGEPYKFRPNTNPELFHYPGKQHSMLKSRIELTKMCWNPVQSTQNGSIHLSLWKRR